MPAVVHCITCRAVVSIPDTLAGRAAGCPLCKSLLPVVAQPHAATPSTWDRIQTGFVVTVAVGLLAVAIVAVVATLPTTQTPVTPNAAKPEPGKFENFGDTWRNIQKAAK